MGLPQVEVEGGAKEEEEAGEAVQRSTECEEGGRRQPLPPILLARQQKHGLPLGRRRRALLVVALCRRLGIVRDRGQMEGERRCAVDGVHGCDVVQVGRRGRRSRRGGRGEGEGEEEDGGEEEEGEGGTCEKRAAGDVERAVQRAGVEPLPRLEKVTGGG